MDGHSLSRSRTQPANRDLDSAGRPAAQIENCRRPAMARHGPLAGSENRCQTASMRREPMAHREHRCVHAVQAMHRDSMPYRLIAHAERAQLIAGDDAVLPLEEFRHTHIGMGCQRFPLYYPRICCHPSIVIGKVLRGGGGGYAGVTCGARFRSSTARSPRSTKAVSLPGPQSIWSRLPPPNACTVSSPSPPNTRSRPVSGRSSSLPGPPSSEVGAAAAGDAVVALVALRGGRARCCRRSCRCRARQHVVGAARAGHVVAPDHVVAGEALDGVVARAAQQRVVQLGPVERVGRAAADLPQPLLGVDRRRRRSGRHHLAIAEARRALTSRRST